MITPETKQAILAIANTAEQIAHEHCELADKLDCTNPHEAQEAAIHTKIRDAFMAFSEALYRRI